MVAATEVNWTMKKKQPVVGMKRIKERSQKQNSHIRSESFSITEKVTFFSVQEEQKMILS
jgi:hypothetical protein